jgi:flagellar export protein FliJ
MPRFVFKAEPALDLRRRREDAARQAQSEATAACAAAQRAFDDAAAAVSQSVAELAALDDPARAAWYRNWISRQRQDVAIKKARLTERRAALDRAVARLNLAHRDVRALERLRARALAAWQLAEQRAEQKELDWLASVRYALRDNESEDRR